MMQNRNNVALFLFLIWLGSLGATILIVSYVEAPRATGFGAIFAGVSAIVAAAIAYKGATAKAELDRDIDIRSEYRRKLNLHLVADQVLASLEDQCQSEPLDHFILSAKKEDARPYLSKKRYRLTVPPKIDLIWDDLASFNDPKIITSFRTLNKALETRKKTEMEIGRYPSIQKSPVDIGKEIPFALFQEFVISNRDIHNEARVLRGLIRADIPDGQIAYLDRLRFILNGKSTLDFEE